MLQPATGRYSHGDVGALEHVVRNAYGGGDVQVGG